MIKKLGFAALVKTSLPANALITQSRLKEGFLPVSAKTYFSSFLKIGEISR